MKRGSMKVGDRVRVKDNVTVWVETPGVGPISQYAGKVGTISKVINLDYDPGAAPYNYRVQFDSRDTGGTAFAEYELEQVV